MEPLCRSDKDDLFEILFKQFEKFRMHFQATSIVLTLSTYIVLCPLCILNARSQGGKTCVEVYISSQPSILFGTLLPFENSLSSVEMPGDLELYLCIIPWKGQICGEIDGAFTYHGE